MSLCSECGMQTVGEGLCGHHVHVRDSEWCQSNRRWCDLVHRGVIVGIGEAATFVVGEDSPIAFSPVENYFAEPAEESVAVA